VPDVIRARTNKNGFRVLTVHYSMDDVKGREPWLKVARKNITPEMWEQEYEISYLASHAKRYFAGFSRAVHARALLADPEGLIFRSWDFGYHHPAVIWAQKDTKDRLLVLAEYMPSDMTIDNFAQKVVRMTGERFPNCEVRDFCDPAGTQRSDKGEKSSIEILNAMGIRPQYRKTLVMDGVTILRRLLQVREDGEPGVLFDVAQCPRLLEAFDGGCHYPENRPDDEVYEKDGFYEHLVDALRYLVVHRFRVTGEDARSTAVYQGARSAMAYSWTSNF